jgi:hypothetical protein
MPDNDKACGFISGKQELMNWAKHELFQFEQDTRSYHGTLHELLPHIENQDVIDSAKIMCILSLSFMLSHGRSRSFEYWRLKKHV